MLILAVIILTYQIDIMYNPPIMNVDFLPNDPAILKGLIAGLSAKNEADLAQYQNDIADKDSYIRQLEEQVRLLKALRFAARSEKNRPVSCEEQYRLFDEAEMSSSPEEVESDVGEDEEVSHVGAHTRKKRGRRPIPPEYPRVEVVHDIPEEEKVCPCGCQLTRIGEEVSEKLDIIPQKIQVIRTIRPKYACRACEGVEDEGPTVKIASMPPQIIPQGIVTPGLLAYILTNKFEDGLPFYRQQKMFDRLGVDISRGVMSAWALRAAEASIPLIELVHNHIRSGPLINMDESPVQVLLEPGRKNTSKSFMWVARGGPPGQPAVLFHYDPGRGGRVAQELVGDFKGYLQTDGYAGYNALGARDGLTHVGCLAHVRRKFMAVLKGSSSKHKAGTASTVVNLIGKLYHLEKQADEQSLDLEGIKNLRQERAKPIMDKIKAILDERVETTPPKSLLGKAVTYALGQWDRLTVYLEDGLLGPDNNPAENAIRPFAVGRKNWLFSGSPSGAKASAAIYSLIESAKANGLNPYEYLITVFEKLPTASSQEDLKALLPHNLKIDSATA